MTTRGAIWVTWGKPSDDLKTSVDSVARTNPDLGRCLFTDGDHDYGGAFTHVIPFKPSTLDCRCRALQLARTPFDVSVHLDTDTVVMGDLGFGFEVARTHGLACSIAPAGVGGEWHGMPAPYPSCLPQYNAGVLFFDRSMRWLMLEWARRNKVASLSRFPRQDQPGLAAAVWDHNVCPYVLPQNWNFRPDVPSAPRTVYWQGAIKVWHSKLPAPESPGQATNWNRLTMEPARD